MNRTLIKGDNVESGRTFDKHDAADTGVHVRFMAAGTDTQL